MTYNFKRSLQIAERPCSGKTNLSLNFTSEFIKIKFYRLSTIILHGRPLEKFDVKNDKGNKNLF